ncbi:V/A-type H+-transporting ATPase subunit F [Caloramator proteoclasticus DSM 10124]|uniref:V/A-type H+-transporting ATPase subunit F n=2 Tax=Caloramator TaxID=44258 RepID=A0A1M5BDW9_9CLOT|nr:V/A-type H+-transporting ATPase subunit F [Caloramator proteoclasticus DSM 10124]
MIYMYKIGVVGEKDAVIAFLSLGMTVSAVDTVDEAIRAVDKMAREGYGLIFLTETFAKDMEETLLRYQNQMVPAVILIPGTQGSLGIGLAKIRDNVEKAVGVDILSKKEG